VVEPIRIVIAEDQGMLLGALSALLELESDIRVVAKGHNGDEALQLVEQHRPDILLTDIEMPGKTGLDVAQVLFTQKSATKVIVLTTFARSGYLQRAMAFGVKGYLLKDAPSEELVKAIRKVMMGGKVVDPELISVAWDSPNPLTDKERTALKLVADGLPTKQVAQQLFLSEGTVRNYLSEAIAKLDASNRVDAARIARQKGWL
jgi:two-component system response regulator DesR